MPFNISITMIYFENCHNSLCTVQIQYIYVISSTRVVYSYLLCRPLMLTICLA